jgi:hypothetical protein
MGEPILRSAEGARSERREQHGALAREAKLIFPENPNHAALNLHIRGWHNDR